MLYISIKTTTFVSQIKEHFRKGDESPRVRRDYVFRDRDETDTRLGQNFETETETENKLVYIFETDTETKNELVHIFETETRPRPGLGKISRPRPR